MMKTITTRIDALEQRLKQLKTKQQQIDARRRALESRKARRDELRRKILVGAVVLGKVEQGDFQKGILEEWLDEALTRDEDRRLFKLAPLPQDPPQSS